METTVVSSQQWQQYEQDGYLRLGNLLSAADLKALQQRIDDIMLGKAAIDYQRLLIQIDSDDGQNAGVQSKGFKGATRAYRKIQDLEHDSLFLEYLQRPLFRKVCEQIYGTDVPIAAFRAMFMNKPARKGTLLPWHQDRWSHLNRDPLITVWTALDPATIANGCVEVIPGSHRSLVNPDHPSGFVTEEQAATFAPAEKGIPLELAAGEGVLLHNWLLHRSASNATDTPRRAFSVCYMDGRTQASNDEQYPIVFAGASQ